MYIFILFDIMPNWVYTLYMTVMTLKNNYINMQEINEQWVLQNMVSDKFCDETGNIEAINYFSNKVEIVYTDGQTLVFTVYKTK